MFITALIHTGIMAVIFLWIIILALVIGFCFWRLHFEIDYEHYQLIIYWLPPLFKPLRLKLISISKQQKRKRQKRKRSWKFYFQLLRSVLRFYLISQLDFLLVPGYAHVQCIITVRGGDIIRSCLLALKAELSYRRRIRYGKGGTMLWKDRI